MNLDAFLERTDGLIKALKDEVRKEYDENFLKRVREYLCPELSSGANINRYGDCRKCKDTHGMRRGLIHN